MVMVTVEDREAEEHWLALGVAPAVALLPSCGEAVGVVEAERLPVMDDVLLLQGVAPPLAVVLPDTVGVTVPLPLPVAPAARL